MVALLIICGCALAKHKNLPKFILAMLLICSQIIRFLEFEYRRIEEFEVSIFSLNKRLVMKELCAKVTVFALELPWIKTGSMVSIFENLPRLNSGSFLLSSGNSITY